MTKNNKRILVVAYRFFPPRRGGELTLFEQLEYLTSRGYFCTALHFRGWDGRVFKKERIFKRKGIQIIQSVDDSEGYIKSVIMAEQPSIVYASSFPAPKTLALAKHAGIKTILGVYSIGDIKNIYTGKYRSFSQRGLVCMRPASVFKLADAVVAPSLFLGRAVRRFARKSVKVIYPVSPLDKVKADKGSRKYITIINPAPEKGISLMAAIAASLPSYQFLVVGKFSRVEKYAEYSFNFLRQMRNVTLLPYQDTLRKVYEKTKILMMPSLLDESFGRVVWEAMVNGIPVIASKKGNLPFLVRDAGFLCSLANVKSWRESIKRLMNNNSEYKKKSRIAYKLSSKYDYEIEMRKLHCLTETLINKTIE